MELGLLIAALADLHWRPSDAWMAVSHAAAAAAAAAATPAACTSRDTQHDVSMRIQMLPGMQTSCSHCVQQ
jgi:hypothetical protein